MKSLPGFVIAIMLIFAAESYGQHEQYCPGGNCAVGTTFTGNLRTRFISNMNSVRVRERSTFSVNTNPVFRPRFNPRPTYSPHIQYAPHTQYKVRPYLPRTYFPRPQTYFYSDFYQGLP